MGTRCGAPRPGRRLLHAADDEAQPGGSRAHALREVRLLGSPACRTTAWVLRSKAAANEDAKRAIDLFVYRITREIGSLIAALGGLDGLIFTAGIGENDAATRAEVMQGLAWAGLKLDGAANASGGPRSRPGRRAPAPDHPHQRGTGDRAADAERERCSAALARIVETEDHAMAKVKTKSDDSTTEHELGDESFMSAADLRTYMAEMQMARAGKSLEGMDRPTRRATTW